MEQDTSRSFLVEIATSDFHTTRQAVAGGADRIELCANLAEGGTTPSMGHIRQCREAFSLPIFPIIRPRGGDFLFDEEEFQIMRKDIRLCRELGCDGVVTGLLNRDGSVDEKRTARLVEEAYPLSVTFHRAFDRCRNPFEALEKLVQAGCERILTSGQQPLATDGIDLLARLQEAAAGRITILVGSGVRPDTAVALAAGTGCTEFHASLRGKTRSAMEFIHPAFATDPESYTNNDIDPEEVKALKRVLQDFFSAPQNL